MRLVLMFFVWELMLAILGVLVAFLGGVLALQSMYRAWLERLVPAIRRGPVLLILLAFGIVVTTTTIIVILPLVVVAVVLVASPGVATVTSMMLFHHIADLLIVPLAQFAMHLASHALLNLTLAFLRQGAVCYL